MKNKEQIIQEIKQMLKRHGYIEDTFGNMKKTMPDSIRRYKFQNVSLRYESQVIHSDGSKSWVRIASGYYKSITITAEDRIRGLKR
jgi:hypothetical protein